MNTRIHKYRALSLEEKPQWMYISLSFPWPKPHNSDSVGESTGLLDGNGKEIYEGDILFNSKYKQNVFIFWREHEVDKESWLSWKGGWSFASVDGSILKGLYPKHLEVIGNIHQNPDLLKKD